MSALWILLLPVSCRIVVLFAVVLEIVTQGLCLCVTTPRATSRKTAPFYFRRIRHSQDFFAYISLICGVLCVEMQCFFFKDKSDVCHKDLPRVYQKQNLALSWFKPVSTSSYKKRVGASLRKTLRCFNTVFWRPYQFFHSPYCKYSQCFTLKRCNKIQILVMDVWPSALIWKN